ncbi:FG-GAP repeat domain-containing protein [Actinoplanes sp. CA-015351]|uniref:FG-GAP repeat domain-containing protein n=1 Tax=Actinoplanes sp. CA-015351 TaxID=3239897 RepID=UPI003D96F940
MAVDQVRTRATGFTSGSRAVHRLMLAASLTAATISIPAPAEAAPALALAAAPRETACVPGTSTASDEAIAKQLRPLMNGRRLGSLVSGRAIACARVIVARVKARDLPERAAVIAITTAITESTLNNHRVALDHDSLGLFQQRPSQGWGSTSQLVDPAHATDAFLKAMLRKLPGGAWMTGGIGAICQYVQTSAYPGAYTPEVHDAALIVASLWTTNAASPAPATSAAASPTPTGPYQAVTATAETEIGTLTGRHDLLMADWNGDKHNDLLVVNGAGLATGKTEVRVMDGARDYASLLLTTATAVPATDERHDYTAADWNGDGRPDLVVVQKTGTGSGKVEIVVADGASSFRNLTLTTTTSLAADDKAQFAMTDWNADGRPDLVAVRTSGTASGKVEVRILDGASNFQRDLVPAITTAEPARDGQRAEVLDWNHDTKPDVVLVRKPATAAGKTELHVLDGAAQLSRTLVKQSTVLGLADDRFALLLADAGTGKRPDLVVIQKTGTANGRGHVWVIGG